MPLKFRKVLIADERYESAGVFDVNGDGLPDIVSGAWWYEGPDFKKRHRIGPVAAHDEYYDDFSTIPLDVNGNGRLDFITGGWWGNTLRWRENPGDPDREWPEHVIAEVGNVETTRAWDVDGDGVPEIVPNCPNGPLTVFKLDTDARGRGLGTFTAHRIFEGPQGHGLGAGDIAGNGRVDFALNHGWLEAPARPFDEPWVWHPEYQLSGSASVPILVADVNGDGLNDLIVGAGHDYGLHWVGQGRDGAGNRTWTPHCIDPDNSQYHDMMWLDLDGDGAPELVTGKRYRAHCGFDPGAFDPYGCYYFKWNGAHFTKQVIAYGPVRESKGLGLQFAVADLTGNGLPDIVAPGKDGLCVFYNEG
ncbi:MAG: VCBS repeat-containing protein [Candidatus Hydrogenedens sp.]|nr:VCBS repeat-containing protein [Candidatus Hydrogenedentota bacterium]NLF57876.1 VCBS repeat-containing protein [Candidatus Hydrogenedens sp.]